MFLIVVLKHKIKLRSFTEKVQISQQKLTALQGFNKLYIAKRYEEKMMNKITFKEFDILKDAIGDRVNLSNQDIMKCLDSISEENNKKVTSFFNDNPIEKEFFSLLRKKETLSKNDFNEQIEAFYQKNPNYRDEKFQKETFNRFRRIFPAGSVIKVTGGYAVLETQKRTGRSPKETFPVMTPSVADIIDFKHTKGSVTEADFEEALAPMLEYMKGRKLYRTDRFVAQGELSIPVTTITESPFIAGFTMNMFRNDEGQSEQAQFEPWLVLQCPSFVHPDKERFGDAVFKFTNYEKRIILIGGSGYSGEVKKGLFTVANHIMPQAGHLSFHCSSVYNPEADDVTLIFGLSGTGKSTVASGLSGSKLLSDDETALDLKNKKTLNIENGNYYKTGGLLQEPKVLQILNNMPQDTFAIYENIIVDENFHPVFAVDPTDNGRVSIPLISMPAALKGGMYPLPSKMIILSRDVNAVLDPINLLSKEQIVYYLALGYTSKTPGTEAGITKPIPTYSKWEGGPFYDLKDDIMMKTLLGFLDSNEVEGVLLNSGEGGGPFGSKENSRFPVDVTLELARALMQGNISKQRKAKPESFEENQLMSTVRPKSIDGVSQDINDSLNAQSLWEKNGHGDAYVKEATALFNEFKKHAENSLALFKGDATIDKILMSGPKV